MLERTFAGCVYYYSLPEFPTDCVIVRNNSLFVRDVLVSNHYNPHIRLGGQYDPHYENRPAPEYKLCQKGARKKIMSKILAGDHDQIYLLFRTNKGRLLDRSTQHIAGYYAIDEHMSTINSEYEEPVLYAKEARFTDIENAPDLSSFLDQYHNRRFFFSSETRNGKFNHLLGDWIDSLKSAPNLFPLYVTTTKQLDRLFKYYEFNDRIYEPCESCSETDKCPLVRRIRKKGKLYHQLPKDIALRIRRYYRTLGES